MSATPLTIRMHERDNVAIVANDGGLAAGSVLPSGLVLRDRVPQGHKVALVDIAADAPVLRYGIPIGHALKDIAAGSWVHERLLKMPAARGLEGLPIATVKPPQLPPLRGLYLRGLPQCRRLGGHAQHPGHHADGAVRGGRHRLRGAAHQGRAAAALSERRRRGRAGARLRLRRGHRRARCGGADTHAAQHQPEPQLRRRGDGGQPGLREAAARAAAAAGQLRDRR